MTHHVHKYMYKNWGLTIGSMLTYKSFIHIYPYVPGSFCIMLDLPLSFHADTHHKVGSVCRMGKVAPKYSKKSGAMSRSSKTINNTILIKTQDFCITIYNYTNDIHDIFFLTQWISYYVVIESTWHNLTKLKLQCNIIIFTMLSEYIKQACAKPCCKISSFKSTTHCQVSMLRLSTCQCIQLSVANFANFCIHIMLHSADGTNIICMNLWPLLNTTLLFFYILFCTIFGTYQDAREKFSHRL